MGNRKLPFGYQMRMGEIVRNEPEANAVQDIFLQYSLGASLKEIAEQMSKTGPTYDEGKSWNKNMVARILENAKYTGADSYPELVDIIGERLSQLPVKQLGKIRTADREDPLQIRQA